MTDRPTHLERAFALASSGRVGTMLEMRQALRSEGYSEEGQLHGRSIINQLMKLMAEAKAKSNA
jgi:hypothetical protein